MRLYKVILLFVLFALCGGYAFAQGYPTHAIKIVLPFPAGGVTDTTLRLVTGRLSVALGQPVTVENKPGAGATLGTDYVAKSAPDGYTLIVTTSPSIAPGPLMHTKMLYDPIKDFVHIAMFGVFPQDIVVRADHPARTLQELIALVKAKPGVINYASAGVGSSGYLTVELLKKLAGLDMVHIPYKGMAPAVTDLLGGRLDMIVTSSAGDLIGSGRARILAVTSKKRSSRYPNVPTLEEVVPGVHGVAFMGISAPAQTPPAIVKRLEAAIMSVATAPDIQARFAAPSIGMIPMPLNSEQFLEYIKNENRTWAPLIESNHIIIN